MQNTKFKFYALLTLTLLIGAAAGYYGSYRVYRQNKQQVLAQVTPIRSKDNSYKFINPLLGYDLPESTQFGQYTDLDKKLNDLISQEQSNGRAQQISVYFRGNQGRCNGEPASC